MLIVDGEKSENETTEVKCVSTEFEFTGTGVDSEK